MPLNCVGISSPYSGEVVLPSRYLDIDHIGKGATCVVVKAHDTFLDRKVAIKFMRPELTDYTSMRRFQQEAKMMSGFSLMHLPVVLDFGLGSCGRPYMVMELVEGTSLKEIIEQGGPVNVGFAIEICIQVLAALEHAHERGIVHRDLKAHNIVVTKREDGKPLAKVVDFGLAGGINRPGHITEAGAALGTPFYMSPEQAQGKATDARSDLYSLGCVLFEMLTGTTPFERNSMAETLDAHIRVIAPSLGSMAHLDNEMLGELEVVVAKMLEKNPDKRYQTASELQAELLELADKMRFDEAQRLRKLLHAVAMSGRKNSTSMTNLKAIQAPAKEETDQHVPEFASWENTAGKARRHGCSRYSSREVRSLPRRFERRSDGMLMILWVMALAIVSAGAAILFDPAFSILYPMRASITMPCPQSIFTMGLMEILPEVDSAFDITARKALNDAYEGKFHISESRLWALPDMHDSDLVSLNKVPGIVHVNLVTAQTITGGGLHDIKKLPIERMDLRGLSLSQAAFDAISEMPCLTTLRIDYVPTLTTSKLARLKQCPSLEILTLRGSKLSRQMLFQLSQLEHLTGLALDNSTGFDDSSLESFVHMPNLKWLSLRDHHSISNEALARFKNARPDVKLDL